MTQFDITLNTGKVISLTMEEYYELKSFFTTQVETVNIPLVQPAQGIPPSQSIIWCSDDAMIKCIVDDNTDDNTDDK